MDKFWSSDRDRKWSNAAKLRFVQKHAPDIKIHGRREDDWKMESYHGEYEFEEFGKVSPAQEKAEIIYRLNKMSVDEQIEYFYSSDCYEDIQYVENQSSLLIEFFLSQTGYEFEHLFEHHVNEMLLHGAIRRDPNCIKMLHQKGARGGERKRHLPVELIEYAVLMNPALFSDYIDELKYSTTLHAYIVANNPEMIGLIRNPSLGLQYLAIEKQPITFRHLRFSVTDEGLIDYAISRSGQNLKYLDRSQENDDRRRKALLNDGTAIEYINDPTEEMQMLALKQNLKAVMFIKHPTLTVQQYVLSRDISAAMALTEMDPSIALALLEGREFTEKQFEIASKWLNEEGVLWFVENSNNFERRWFKYLTTNVHMESPKVILFLRMKYATDNLDEIMWS